jgi:hypothetical protein
VPPQKVFEDNHEFPVNAEISRTFIRTPGEDFNLTIEVNGGYSDALNLHNLDSLVSKHDRLNMEIAGYINLDGIHHHPINPARSYLRAFVETGSDSPYILASYGKSNAGIALYSLVCEPYTRRDKKGVVITVAFSNDKDAANADIAIVLVQQGATKYGQPVFVPFPFD